MGIVSTVFNRLSRGLTEKLAMIQAQAPADPGPMPHGIFSVEQGARMHNAADTAEAFRNITKVQSLSKYDRSRGIKALGTVLAARPELAGQILPIIDQFSTDSNKWVRQAVAETVGAILVKRPELTEQALPVIQKLSADSNIYPREAVAEFLPALTFAYRPDMAPQLLPVLGKLSQDKESYVSSTVTKGAYVATGGEYRVRRSSDRLNNLITSNPNLAEHIIPILKKFSECNNDLVTQKVVSASALLISIRPDLAGQALGLITSFIDANPIRFDGTRTYAAQALGTIGTTIPELSEQVLPGLTRFGEQGAKDRRRELHATAVRSLNDVAEYRHDLKPQVASSLASIEVFAEATRQWEAEIDARHERRNTATETPRAAPLASPLKA